MGCLCQQAIKTSFWKENKSQLPKYDIDNMIETTLAQPKWIHFGAGNIFRIFIAGLQECLLNEGLDDTGILVAECFDPQILDAVYDPCDNLTLAVTLKPSGALQQQVIASVAAAYSCNRQEDAAWERLMSYVKEPQLQMISFTITEKGYRLTTNDGDYLPAVVEAIKEGPGKSDNIVVNVASLLYHRFQAGALPIAMASMDNCAANGRVLYNSVHEIAEQWANRGLVEKGFLAYLECPQKVSFPWSMIDKITPRPSEAVKEQLEQQGIEKMDIFCTSKKTFIAPFVNAEETQYLVIEDSFPNGRPPLEKAGVLFADRQTVAKVEKMKVMTCLNPLHTALAIFGCLLGYTSIAAEISDPQLRALIKCIGYDEAMPVVVHPGVIEPKAFIDEVINNRFPNPFIPDTPQRIATDTSQKMAIRFGETLKAYVEEGKDLSALIGIPIVIAGWLRYLLASDDTGADFVLSPDPMLEKLCPFVKKAAATDDPSCLDTILTDKTLFKVDLLEIGIAETIKKLFCQMTQEEGAVRRTLKERIEGGK